ncbi:hypothetical protein GDO78_002020 [Eleutherodactylus coqui]|uniref:Uncharacterized protein n=1 Tax=Eleutherodactylus coqui TaxID=57060 RepID=A0A8J6KPB2_ELECQ|nr:hypothetical protein GDO78_002020 [Eleutherodactylus coqui]
MLKVNYGTTPVSSAEEGPDSQEEMAYPCDHSFYYDEKNPFKRSVKGIFGINTYAVGHIAQAVCIFPNPSILNNSHRHWGI